MQEKTLTRHTIDNKNIVHLYNSCKKKKKRKSQPKSKKLCFIWWEFLGLQTQRTASQVTMRELLQGGKGGLGYIRFLQKKKKKGKQSEISKDYC